MCVERKGGYMVLVVFTVYMEQEQVTQYRAEKNESQAVGSKRNDCGDA